MKILQVVDFFKPSWEAGGIVRVCYELSKRLSDNGHEVTVYTTDGSKSRLKVKKNQPVDVESMEVYYFRNVSNSLAKRNFYLPYLLPYVAKRDMRRFDIVHIHTFRRVVV
jgi:glycosyltransferase involved in cell wall biosynthesis